MTKKEKLQELLIKLNTLQGKDILPLDDNTSMDSLIEEEVAKITARVKENPTVRTLQKFNSELAKFKKDFDLKPIIDLIKGLQQEIKQSEKDLVSEFEDRINAIPKTPDLTNAILALKIEFDSKFANLLTPEDLKPDFENIKVQLQTLVDADIEEKKEIKGLIEKLKLDLLNRIANIGGGNMNRQVLFNGVDRLTRYTDYNLKPGANVTFTVANDDVNKRVNLTIAATGGGGGSGITRSIQSISADQVADSASTTDYVYVCSGTMTLTMPTCVGNTDLYTIKNAGTGVITVAFAGAETGDGQTTLVMPVRYTSIDISSDGVSNWQIT